MFFLLKRNPDSKDVALGKKLNGGLRKSVTHPILNVLVVLDGPEKWPTIMMKQKPDFLRRRAEALKMGLEASGFAELMHAVNLQDNKLVEEWFEKEY